MSFLVLNFLNKSIKINIFFFSLLLLCTIFLLIVIVNGSTKFHRWVSNKIIHSKIDIILISVGILGAISLIFSLIGSDLSSAGSWYSGFATVLAVFCAYYQLREMQSESNESKDVELFAFLGDKPSKIKFRETEDISGITVNNDNVKIICANFSENIAKNVTVKITPYIDQNVKENLEKILNFQSGVYQKNTSYFSIASPRLNRGIFDKLEIVHNGIFGPKFQKNIYLPKTFLFFMDAYINHELRTTSTKNALNLMGKYLYCNLTLQYSNYRGNKTIKNFKVIPRVNIENKLVENSNNMMNTYLTISYECKEDDLNVN